LAQSAQLDALEFSSVEFPYNLSAAPLDNTPRWVDGLNTYTTFGGTLVKRPGTIKVDDTNITKVCRRAIVVETLDTPPLVYLLGSFLNAGTSQYEVYYNRLDGGSPGWTKIDDVRGINTSSLPHEMLAYRGKAYIRGIPASDLYGSVIFNPEGGSATVDLWGLENPTEAAGVVNPGSWNTTQTDHGFDIKFGWKYCYCWESRTGHVSCRSPLETNPDKNPSDTGAVTMAASTGYCPEVVVTGHADTTRVPYINIYRTTDGGGSFYFVKQIANPGATTTTFVDKYLESGVGGGTFKDPLTDLDLDFNRVAPDTEKNGNPPTTISPNVMGTDPVKRSTPLAIYAGRIWYGIGNYIFYSGNEEIFEGVPEEAFPFGLYGNYIELPYPVTNLVPASDAIYFMTTQATYRCTGTDRETFSVRVYLNNVGHPYGHPRAAAVVGDTVIWLTHDYRIATVQNGNFSVFSDPLYADINNAVIGTGEIEIQHWSELDKDWLIVYSHRLDDTEQSRQWVCDLKRTDKQRTPFWETPWTIRATCGMSGRLKETVTNRRASHFVWDGTTTTLVYSDPLIETVTDYTAAGGNRPYSMFVVSNLFTIPPGNHINSVNAPVRVPTVHAIQIERTWFAGDDDPRMYAYMDDFWNDPIDLPVPYDPPRRVESKGFKTQIYNVGQHCYRCAFKLTDILSADKFELNSFAIVWNPGGV
jgi:hypothetical protein